MKALFFILCLFIVTLPTNTRYMHIYVDKKKLCMIFSENSEVFVNEKAFSVAVGGLFSDKNRLKRLFGSRVTLFMT